MIRSQPKAALSTQLELTPLIDIVFIVVVFLLLTANARLLALPVNIPQTEQQAGSPAPAQAPLTLTIQPQSPHFAINQTTFDDWQTFETALTAKLNDADIEVTIAADRNADVEPLLKLLSLLTHHQITNTQILMEQQP